MNPLLVLVVLGGGLVGTGVALATARRRDPALVDALVALDERLPPRSNSGALLERMLRRLPGTVPESDLALLGWSHERFMVARVTTTLGYAAAGPVLALLGWLLDLGLPITVPSVFIAVGAFLGWTSAARSVQQRAQDAREELRFALAAYLQQAGLLRHGGAGVATALTLPAQILSDGWAMQRIGDELELAERAGQMPWVGLRRFGELVDVDELSDLSAIAASAGHDGAAVIDTLLARAESLRDELLADEHAEAHRASGQMSTPGALQVFLIAAWVLYPAAVALLSL